MSGTVTKKEKFKAAFGFVSKNVLAEKKKQVGGVIKQLEDAMASLPAETGSTHMAYHPGKKGNAEDYKTMRTRLDEVETGRDEKEAFKECERIEQQTRAALKHVPALAEAEKQKAGMQSKTAAQLDKLVKDLGDKVESPEDRGAIIAALKARFGLDELGGELSSNALPRLYKALLLVPENHTKLNPQFQKITRSKVSDTSLYGKGVININAGGAGPFSSEREKYNDGAGKKMEFNKFDAHTLHEVGHSVDDAAGYMAKHQKDASHGGWEVVTNVQVGAAAGKMLQQKFPDLPKDLLNEIALLGIGSTGKADIDAAIQAWKAKKGTFDAVGTKTLLADPSVKAAEAALDQVRGQVSKPPSNQDMIAINNVFSLTQIMKPTPLKGPQRTMVMEICRSMKDTMLTADEAVKKYEATVDTASDDKLTVKIAREILDWSATVKKDLWFNPGAIPKVKVNDQVFQQDGKTWWRYEAAARSQAVNNYQFRSPSEWFAEVYTVSMLGKLANSHPCAGVMKTIDTTKKIT